MNADLANAEPNPELPLEDRLVAYLDGELDPVETRRVEQLLADDDAARRKLHELQQTWDLLGQLDRAAVEGAFTQTTLEMVAVEAAVEAKQAGATSPGRRRQRWIAGGALALALLVGFAAAAMLWPDPNRELLRDLPILENLDGYLQVGDIDLLRRLAKEQWFDQERAEGEETAVAAKGLAEPADDSLFGRRRYIASLSASDQAELLRRQERLSALAPAASQRLRDLDAELQNDPDRAHLRAVLRHYSDWLAALAPYSRSELHLMDSDKAIPRIKTLLDEQADQKAKRLLPRDQPGLLHWMEQYAAKHETRILESVPAAPRQQLEKMASRARRQTSFGLMWWRSQLGGPRHPSLLTDEDFATLKSGLSAETQEALEAKPATEQHALMSDWIRQVMRRQSPGNMKRMLSASDDEKLIEFFETGLDDQQREHLLSLPPDEMQRDLKRLYLTSSKQGEGPRSRPKKPRSPDTMTR